jgi:hypothetical protein
MKEKTYKMLAGKIGARINCLKSDNTEWYDEHEKDIQYIVNNFFPHGSGFDSGTTIDFEKSTGEKLVFVSGFHHMNDGGYYDGWSEHTIIVTPSLQSDFNIRVTGKNRNDIKDYIAEMFKLILSTVLIHDEKGFSLERR